MRLRGLLGKLTDVDNAIHDLIIDINAYKLNNPDDELTEECDTEYIKSSLISAYSSIRKAHTKVHKLIRTEEGDI